MPLLFFPLYIQSPSARRSSSFIVLLPSGSGFVFVRECFGDVVLCFRAPERVIRRFLRFLEVF